MAGFHVPYKYHRGFRRLCAVLICDLPSTFHAKATAPRAYEHVRGTFVVPRNGKDFVREECHVFVVKLEERTALLCYISGRRDCV